MNQADASKISVEESLHAKHGPLALARSRLQIRTSRPAQEQVCLLLNIFSVACLDSWQPAPLSWPFHFEMHSRINTSLFMRRLSRCFEPTLFSLSTDRTPPSGSRLSRDESGARNL
jgi:hypothetical protein